MTDDEIKIAYEEALNEGPYVLGLPDGEDGWTFYGFHDISAALAFVDAHRASIGLDPVKDILYIIDPKQNQPLDRPPEAG